MKETWSLQKFTKCLYFWSNYQFHSFLSCVQWTLETVAHLWIQRRRRNGELEKDTHKQTVYLDMCAIKKCVANAQYASPYGHGALQWWNKSINTATRLLPIGKNKNERKNHAHTHTQQTISKTNTLILLFAAWKMAHTWNILTVTKQLTCREPNEQICVLEYMGSAVWSLDLWGVLCISVSWEQFYHILA